MEKYSEIEFVNIDENKQFIDLINRVVTACFEIENLKETQMYLNVILTNSEEIKAINKKYRAINKETDVLSFPIFQKDEINTMISNCKKKKLAVEEVIGDIIISVPKVEEQANEYGHSVERELAYMIVHGFYHIMGYDHIKEEEKIIMRQKEEMLLNKLGIKREG